VGLNDKAINGNLEWAGGANVSWTPSEYIHPAYYADSGYLLPGFEYGAVHSNSDGLAPDIVFDLGGNHLYYTSVGIFYSGIAETPFIRRGDSAYVIVQGPTWEEAEANAVKLGGHLVAINDAVENQWLVDQYYGSTKLSESLETPTIWIGLNDLAIESSWVWSSGEASSYSNWAPGEPDGTNYYKAGEEYAELVLFDSYNRDPGQWGDNANNSFLSKYGIAEIKLAPNNIPTGTPTLSGTFKAGQAISIDKAPIQDVDNFTGWTPTYSYAWEASADNGTTWSRLTSTDGTDNNSTYILTPGEVGKKVRGVVSYVDGYGSQEAVVSDSSSVIIASLFPVNFHLFTNITRLSWSESLQSFISGVTYSNANFLLAEVPGSGQPFQGDKDGNLNAKTWEKVRFGDLSGEHLPMFTDSSYYYYYGAVNIGSLGGWGLFLTNQNDEFYLLDIDGNCNLSPGTNVGSWDSWLPNTYYFATNVVCSVAGTQIRTPQGERAIETLQPGDLISTANGVKPIVRRQGKLILWRHENWSTLWSKTTRTTKGLEWRHLWSRWLWRWRCRPLRMWRRCDGSQRPDGAGGELPSSSAAPMRRFASTCGRGAGSPTESLVAIRCSMARASGCGRGFLPTAAMPMWCVKSWSARKGSL
jgi:hypothetical protein